MTLPFNPTPIYLPDILLHKQLKIKLSQFFIRVFFSRAVINTPAPAPRDAYQPLSANVDMRLSQEPTQEFYYCYDNTSDLYHNPIRRFSHNIMTTHLVLT